MIVSNFFNISKLLHNRFTKSSIIKLIGTWEGDKVVGGLVWFISPPQTIQDVIDSPLRAITYVTFVCVLCAYLSKYIYSIM